MDDLPDVERSNEDEESEDDDEFDVVAEDEDPLYNLGEAVHAALDDSLEVQE